MKRWVALCSDRMPQDAVKTLEGDGYELIKLPPCAELQYPVASHPDMLFFIKKLDDRRVGLVTPQKYAERHADTFARIRSALSELDRTAEVESEGVNVDATYPEDIAINALEMNGVLYSLTEHTSRRILDAFSRCVRVKQGYACCSVLKLDERSAITSDRGLAAAMRENGADVLEITPGHIALPGYGSGFIGGASFCNEGRVYFFGKISSHPDLDAISEFCRVRGLEMVELSDAPLTDLGGIKLLNI